MYITSVVRQMPEDSKGGQKMKRTEAWVIMMICALMMIISTALADSDLIWVCPKCGKSGNNGNFCPNCATPRPEEAWDCTYCRHRGNKGKYCSECGKPHAIEEQWALAIDRLSINAGPGTKRYFKELGTYRVKDQYVRVLAKSWDTDNDIWWIQCEIPDTNHVVGWTGLKRFDKSTFDLDALPEVIFDRETRTLYY